MSDNDAAPPEKTATQKLAELVTKRKAAAGTGGAGERGGRKGSERAAAALSASKSKPVLRK